MSIERELKEIKSLQEFAENQVTEDPLDPASLPPAPGQDSAHAGEWAALAVLAEPVTPRPDLRDRLMNRVATFERLRPEVEIRQGKGVWKPLSDGVAIQHLFTDPDSGIRTMLIQMQPGSVLAPHFHHHREQCLVLEGEIGWGDHHYRAGDFMVQGAGTEHAEVRSETGVLMLIIAGRNEFIR